MKVVLDTNTLLSGLVTGSAAPANLMALWQEDMFDIYASEHILDGVSRALKKPYWQKRLDLRQLESRFAKLRPRLEMVTPAEGIHDVAEDDEDDMILATALAAGADYLVTGDKYLQRIAQFRGIEIVSPRAFVNLILDRS